MKLELELILPVSAVRLLLRLDRNVERILGLVTRTLREEQKMTQDVSGIVAAVAAVKTLAGSTKELVTQSVALEQAQTAKIQQLIDAAASGGDPIPTETLQQILDDSNASRDALLASNQELADALLANTAQGPAPTDPPADPAPADQPTS